MSFTGSINLWALVQPEELCKWKIPMTPPGYAQYSHINIKANNIEVISSEVITVVLPTNANFWDLVYKNFFLDIFIPEDRTATLSCDISKKSNLTAQQPRKEQNSTSLR